MECYVYKWNQDDQLVVSDFDGTVTKSDIWGFIYGTFGKDYTHSGIARLYSNIEKNGYKFVFLSARPMSHVNLLRKYVHKVDQEGCTLPSGENQIRLLKLLNSKS